MPAPRQKPLSTARRAQPKLPAPCSLPPSPCPTPRDLLRVVAQSQDHSPVHAITRAGEAYAQSPIPATDHVTDNLHDLLAAACVAPTLAEAETHLRWAADQLRHATDAVRAFRRALGDR